MKFKQIVILFLCAAGMVFFSGCYYLRLREVKNQLANFDKYGVIEDNGGLTIYAKKPVLYPEDIVRLANLEPTAKEQTTHELYYDYILEKQYPSAKDEQGDYNIKLRFVFTNGKFNKLLIDQRLFAILPKNVVIALIKELGHAKIDIKKRSFSICADVNQICLADMNTVVASLGRPTWQRDNRYVYNYRLNSLNAKRARKNVMPADFIFDKQGRCIKCRSRVFGVPFEMDIEKLKLPANACSDGHKAKIKIVVNR